MKRVEARVVSKRRLTDDIFSLWIEQSELARQTAPGQFLNVRVGSGSDPLLRRPISAADVRDGQVRLVFRVVGRGTALLSRSRAGDTLDVLGPLGRPAPIPRGRSVLVCGGGVGAAPLFFLTRRLKERNRVKVFLGARSRDQLILARDFRGLGVPVAVATDDGSLGRRGTVVDLAAEAVEQEAKPMVMACGPRAMLAALVAAVDPVETWGFVEERMGCGTGICYCCALKRKSGGYVRVCEDGPVVLLNEVEL